MLYMVLIQVGIRGLRAGASVASQVMRVRVSLRLAKMSGRENS